MKSCFYYRLLVKRGRKSCVLIKPIKYRLGNSEVNIVADEIHQFKGPHREPSGFTHQIIDRNPLAPFRYQKEPLRIKRSRNTANNKHWGRSRLYRHLVPSLD